ncbi:MAG: hypothetical protein HY651_12530 [Acidobacteria bacterium]|nr:hypothetical protein [Acidobacteriota bacterium]
MPWETFRRRTRPSPKEPMVTLSTHGMIGLNAAVVRNVIGEHRFAHLLFDKEKSLIGIKLLKQADPDAYPMQVGKSKSHGSISGIGFLKTYKLTPTHTKAYPARFDQEAKTLIIDVSESITETKVAKRKGKT